MAEDVATDTLAGGRTKNVGAGDGVLAAAAIGVTERAAFVGLEATAVTVGTRAARLGALGDTATILFLPSSERDARVRGILRVGTSLG